MRCDDVLTELVALDRGELAPGAAAAVERHVASCAGCAEELRRARSVRTLFVSATTLPAAGESRVMSAVDDALAAGRAQSAPRGRLADLWAYARDRYEQSSTVRRFAIASLGVHAAAALVLAVVLAGRGGVREGGTVSVTMPDRVVADAHPSDTPDVAADDVAKDESVRAPAEISLTAFVPLTPSGVRSPTGRVFPTAATTKFSTVLDPEGRAALLADAAGQSAPSVDHAAARAVAWLLARQAEDGSFGSAADPSARLSDTSLALLALGADGRTSADPAVARASGFVAAALAEDAPLLAATAHANGVRALVQQFSLDFADLSTGARALRAASIAQASERLARRQRADGAFAADSGAMDVTGTVTSFVALSDVRTAGIADHEKPILAALASLDAQRDSSGMLPLSHADRGRGLSGVLIATERSLGLSRMSDWDAGLVVGARIAVGTDPRGMAAGIDLVRSTGRDVGPALQCAVRRQRTDGSFATDRVSAVESTASGVQALRRVWRR